MNIGFFGGSFDPIHNGHLAVAHAAANRFRLDQVLFVPAAISPHKRKQPITSFIHRYAMIALALNGTENFVPSLLEAPEKKTDVHYSVDTVRQVRQQLKKSDRLFFIIGIDAFNEIASWRQPEALLRSCEFVVVSRPGFTLSNVAKALPERLRSKAVASMKNHSGGCPSLTLPGVTIHLLESVKVPVSATEVRATARSNPRGLSKMVPAEVAAYIKKMHLYEQR